MVTFCSTARPSGRLTVRSIGAKFDSSNRTV